MSFGLGAAIVAPVGVALSAIRFTQAIAASESEAAAGLNCPRRFTLTLDFANARAPAAIDPDAGRPRAAAAATPLILPAAPSRARYSTAP
ncbi:MAG: hypothetical protein IPQ15_17220 [Betaproteobacteria bacterium]|nr:hypothetical protein [Betaproteobacteria bacterium]